MAGLTTMSHHNAAGTRPTLPERLGTDFVDPSPVSGQSRAIAAGRIGRRGNGER
jgi:hypothetical protein